MLGEGLGWASKVGPDRWRPSRTTGAKSRSVQGLEAYAALLAGPLPRASQRTPFKFLLTCGSGGLCRGSRPIGEARTYSQRLGVGGVGRGRGWHVQRAREAQTQGSLDQALPYVEGAPSLQGTQLQKGIGAGQCSA